MAQRVGIVTLHYNFKNFGALLQAYALQRALKERAASVEIVDHRYPGKLKAIGPAEQESHAEGLRFLDSLDSSPAFISEDTRETEAYMDSAYDLLVYGSDEIWKWRFSWTGRQRRGSMRTPVPNIYWPPASMETPRVAYAACSGASRSRIPRRIRRELATSLRGFQDISVRDRPTHDLVHAMTGGSPRRVPDPVFLQDHSDECDFGAIRRKLEEAGADFRRTVVGLYQRRGVFGGFPADASVVNLRKARLSPLEFWGAAKVVDVMATNTLHGTIVSLVHNTPCVHAGRALPKVRELRQRFEIPGGTVSEVMDTWPSHAVAERVQEERRLGLDWLDQTMTSRRP